MNDDIEKINEQNKNIDFPPKSEGDFSQAKNSSITSNEEDKKLSMVQGIIGDLSNQRSEIDSVKEAVKLIADQINALTGAINQLAQGTPATQQGQPAAQGLNMESISAIGDLLEKGAQAYKNLKGGNDGVADSFTQQITDNAKAEAIESLNIVHLINKKVKGKLVQDIAGDIAGNVLSDTSNQNTHAPQ